MVWEADWRVVVASYSFFCLDSEDTFIPTKVCTIHHRWCLRTKPTRTSAPPPSRDSRKLLLRGELVSLKANYVCNVDSDLRGTILFNEHPLTYLTNGIIQFQWHLCPWSQQSISLLLSVMMNPYTVILHSNPSINVAVGSNKRHSKSKRR